MYFLAEMIANYAQITVETMVLYAPLQTTVASWNMF